MMIKLRDFIVGSLLLFCVPLVQAQELNLFEDTLAAPDRGRNARVPRNRNAVTAPAFTLKGTSRFGDSIRTSLLARDGRTVSVQWKEGAVSIDGFRNFSVVAVNSRSVSIRFPENEACVPFEEKGVSCSADGDIAILTLSNPAPIKSSPARNQDLAILLAASEAAADAETDSAVAEENAGPINPFVGLRARPPDNLTPEQQATRDANRAARALRLGNTEVLRIADDDVPADMRRVRTPFGDRLVPLRD